MKKKKNKQIKGQDDFIKDMKEWQNNIYNPGRFVGGEIPPYLKWGKKNRKLITISLLIPIVMIIIIIVILWYTGYSVHIG